MVTKQQNYSHDDLGAFSEALEKSRKMQQDWLTHGLDFVNLYIEDIEENWLDRWDDDEVTVESSVTLASEQTFIEPSVVEFMSAFLASDYPAAVWARESDHPLAMRVQQQMETEGLAQIIARLGDCLSIPDESERLHEATMILAGGVTVGEITRDSGDEEDEFKLFDLAESLLEKLAELKAREWRIMGN
ncbi:MAG: hypothetical protein RIM23_18875 [Coleofasciculus sp. G3-WIS-01]|uniref:hypothetical protein n=1 Tax=Coleofasciculus sp. G3-WIS-01 TaxID=3069528 RepID=UPI0032FC1F62